MPARTTIDNSNAGKLTASSEDYLEAIYQLGGEDHPVRSVDLAAKLNVSKPSVNKALSTLKAVGFVKQPYYGDITLTKLGLDYARGVQSRHDVLLQFLSEVLGVDDELASAEACKMEHAISDDTLKRWVVFMNGWSENEK